MPVLGPNIPFLVLYAKNEVAAKIVRVYMPIFVGNPREDSHIKVKGLLVGKLIIYYLNPQGRPMWLWLKLKLPLKGDFSEVGVTAFFLQISLCTALRDTCMSIFRYFPSQTTEVRPKSANDEHPPHFCIPQSSWGSRSPSVPLDFS